jgi:hypothetical protein
MFRHSSIFIRLQISGTYEGGNHIALFLHLAVKRNTEISFLFILINNVFTILLHIVKFSRNATFSNVSRKDETLAVGVTVEFTATAVWFPFLYGCLVCPKHVAFQIALIKCCEGQQTDCFGVTYCISTTGKTRLNKAFEILFFLDASRFPK